MHSIKLRSRVDADGVLRLEVPVELANLELELVLVYEIAREGTQEATEPEEVPMIKLNREDSTAFVESLLNPPEPSSKMRMAASDYKRSLGL
jgi:uncharacterized protein (DUF1778 family)